MLNSRSANGVLFIVSSRLSVCSILSCFGQIRYESESHKKEALKNQGFFAAPDRIRTCGLSVRSRTLYPLSYGCVRAVFQPVFLFYMESWKMSIPFPLFPFVKSRFILSLPKAAARFHRHTGEWYGQKKICRSLPY